MAYFILRSTEDGITLRYFETREDLEEELEEYAEDGFLEEPPLDSDLSYMQGNLLIKGDVVVPRPVEVVTRLTVD